MPEQPLRIFVGHEPTEQAAFDVCKNSILSTASVSVLVEAINQQDLRTAGLYRRMFYRDGTQAYDAADGKPISTQFSFTRFLVPALCQYSGWAAFCDSDMLWRDDIKDLFALANPRFAVMCVQHEHTPIEDHKMRAGQIQTRYHRKNWSSVMLWNCGHAANRNLTPYMVNTQPGWWLHGMHWLDDSQIGALPLKWNWLEGYSDPALKPSVVHYTTGTPDVPGHESAAYADEWRSHSVAHSQAAE